MLENVQAKRSPQRASIFIKSFHAFMFLSFKKYVADIDSITSITTRMISGTSVLFTNISIARLSINICASTHGIAPLENSLIVPSINVFPSIIR